MALFCNISDLVTESDVEQKLIYPILTKRSPMGLGLDNSQVLTKEKLVGHPIGKGDKRKIYYPDYLIVLRGIPLLVVEAKKPKTDLSLAFSEARLYAQEVNSEFPHGVNVCERIIVCNGTELWAGYSDNTNPEIVIPFDRLNTNDLLFNDLIRFCSINILSALANKPYLKARGKAEFKTPVSQLGGKRVQNAELEENSFGRTFIFENRTIFDPETEEERAIIVQNAYIPSLKREQHMDPIYKEIRKFELPHENNSTQLSTSSPIELLDSISKRIEGKKEAYSLMLLIGNVGSGKTTFVRYFKKIYLEQKQQKLASQCEWVFLNMNLAPVTREEIYSWLKERIIHEIKINHLDINFSDLDTIKRVFRRPINDFNSGLGKLLIDDEKEYNRELYNCLNNMIKNDSTYLDNLLFFLKENYGAIPIVVLDNCDKRSKEEQLLMFEVAQWLRTQFKCLVLLPMRDSTYDKYRSEPPLDTVVKDLVFRIDPPDLFKVIQARLNYIFRITEQNESTYILRNGARVGIKKGELIDYFKAIMQAIRQNKMARNIFYRLSNRNTRNGIQMFEDFCKSGHVNPDDIFGLRVVGSDHQVPTFVFLNALLRKNRKYYNGEQSNFINLFYSSFQDDFPDPFVRIDLLRFLEYNRILQVSTTENLSQVSSVVRYMQIIGHDGNVVRRELRYLIKKGLISSEACSETVENDDLLRIAIPGRLHLKLLSNVNYISACAENLLFKDSGVMIGISERLRNCDYLSKISVALTAIEMIMYLEKYRNEFCSKPEAFLNEVFSFGMYDLKDCHLAINKWVDDDRFLSATFKTMNYIVTQEEILVAVKSKNSGALICRDTVYNSKCFLSVREPEYQLSEEMYSSIDVDDILICRVIKYDEVHCSFQLRFITAHE